MLFGYSRQIVIVKDVKKRLKVESSNLPSVDEYNYAYMVMEYLQRGGSKLEDGYKSQDDVAKRTSRGRIFYNAGEASHHVTTAETTLEAMTWPQLTQLWLYKP